MNILNGWTLAFAVIGIVIYALIHGLGFRLAGTGAKPSFLRRIIIQAVMIPVIMIVGYLLQFVPISILRIFDPIFSILPIGRTGLGLSPEHAGKISMIIMGGFALGFAILLLSILLMGVTKLIAREISLPRAFLAALWAYLIFPGLPAMIGLMVAISRIPG